MNSYTRTDNIHNTYCCLFVYDDTRTVYGMYKTKKRMVDVKVLSSFSIKNWFSFIQSVDRVVHTIFRSDFHTLITYILYECINNSNNMYFPRIRAKVYTRLIHINIE